MYNFSFLAIPNFQAASNIVSKSCHCDLIDWKLLNVEPFIVIGDTRNLCYYQFDHNLTKTNAKYNNKSTQIINWDNIKVFSMSVQ